MGWNFYLVAFFNTVKYGKYVGTDVIPKVIQKSKAIAHFFSGDDKETSFYLLPSERLDKTYSFGEKYANYFDVIFFSPPYFSLEIYPGENQSTINFPEYEDWLRGYWEETIRLCSKCIKRSGILGYVCGDYKDEKWNLVSFTDDLKRIALKYFDLETEMEIMWNGVKTTSAARKKIRKSRKFISFPNKGVKRYLSSPNFFIL